jgi:hypothetical protein
MRLPRPRQLGQGEIFGHSRFRFFLGSDVKGGSHQPDNRSLSVPHRKASHPYPAYIASWPDDAELLVKVPAAGCFVHFSQNMGPVVGMDEFLGRGWVFEEGLKSAPGDDLIGLVCVDYLLAFGIEGPEDLLDVVGHLLEFFRGGLEHIGGFALFATQMAREPDKEEDESKDGGRETDGQQGHDLRSLKVGGQNREEKQGGSDGQNRRGDVPNPALRTLQNRFSAM